MERANPEGRYPEKNHVKAIVETISVSSGESGATKIPKHDEQLQSKHSPSSAGASGADSLSQHCSDCTSFAKDTVEHVIPAKKKIESTSAGRTEYL